MKTLRALAFCLFTLALTGCATAPRDRTVTLPYPVIEYAP